MAAEAEFLKNERPNEYEVSFNVQGGVTVTFKAENLEEANQKAKAMLDDEEFGLEIDEIHYIDMEKVRKTSPMYLVCRGGKNMQVSHLKMDDVPRQPDEGGF